MSDHESERYIVIGGQGFIGAWIVQQLVHAHNVKPADILVADLAPRNNHILAQILDETVLSAIVRADVDVTDVSSIRAALATFQPHYVIHLAGLQVPTCRANPLLGARVNVDGKLRPPLFLSPSPSRPHTQGTVAVLSCCVEARVRSVCYASSAAACGPAEDYPSGCRDDDNHRPRTHYGVYKLANEGSARIFWQDNALPSVGLRPLTVYGVGREIGMTSGPTKAIKAALLGRDYIVQFKGETVFNYARDIAELFIRCVRAVAQPGKQGAWRCNIAGAVCSAEAFVAEVGRQLGGAGLVEEGRIRVKSDAPNLPFPVLFDESNLRALLDGQVPCCSIEEGIQDTIRIMQHLQSQGRLAANDLEDGTAPAKTVEIEP